VIKLDEVGAFAEAPSAAGVRIRFGVCLPSITHAAFQVRVLVIHSADRFDPDVPPLVFDLDNVGGDNNLWSSTVNIPPRANTHFGLSGTYLYRFQLARQGGGVVTEWFTDPFARLTDDVGQLSAVRTADGLTPFVWEDDAWRVPDIPDLLVYELHVEEFNTNFAGVVDRLDYVRSLGVNCLELMPVTSLATDFDWGYGPLHYFAPNQRWGGPEQFKRLVNECHKRGIAVILDVVYQHVFDPFPYRLVYSDAGLTSPMIVLWPKGTFGWVVDYAKQFARDYVNAANEYWLSEYHVDGFRYDQIENGGMYNDPHGDPYAGIAFNTYNYSFGLPRFTPSASARAGEFSRVIQVPEALGIPQEVIRTTYSRATWQNNLLDKAENMALWGCYVDDQFVLRLDADFNHYPRTKQVLDNTGAPVDMPVAPFQYINTHDHSHLLAFLTGDHQNPYSPLADRSRWYKIQPFVIALYTCQGVPMLWQGQEVSDNWALAGDGDLRVHIRRDMHWEYFYDPNGRPLVRLHRILGTLRRNHAALRSRDSFYYNQSSRPADGVVVYGRFSSPETALVFLNFSDLSRTLWVPAPAAGTYRELIDDRERAAHLEVHAANVGDLLQVSVPPNYGCIFVNPPPVA
jgi:1,4-alpha-glucan branching enzyme